MKAKITYRFTLQADGKINDLQFLGQGDGALPADYAGKLLHLECLWRMDSKNDR